MIGATDAELAYNLSGWPAGQPLGGQVSQRFLLVLSEMLHVEVANGLEPSFVDPMAKARGARVEVPSSLTYVESRTIVELYKSTFVSSLPLECTTVFSR